MRERAHELVHVLAQEEVTQRWARGSRNTIATPEDVLGHRNVQVLGSLQAALTDRLRWVDHPPEDSSEERVERVYSLAVAALSAPAYLWTDDISHAILADETPLPAHTVSPESLATPVMWWAWERAWAIGSASSRNESEVRLEAALVVDYQDADTIPAFLAFIYGGFTSEAFVMTHHSVPYGQYPYEGDLVEFDQPLIRGWLRQLSFLNSPYIPKQERQPSRAARRASARNGDRRLEDVTFVDLRRVREASVDPGDGSREYKHRWIVRAHHRAQWYPSTQEHRLIWIPPYIKGPDGAPMLEHVYRVKR